MVMRRDRSSMKILLLGEYSSLHSQLKAGLAKLGHEVVSAATGDGFKKIPADISFECKWPGVAAKIYRQYSPIWMLSKLQKFDVVQLINPFAFYGYGFPAHFFHLWLRSHNEKFFMLAAGSDAFCMRYALPKLRYSPLADFLKYDIKKDTYYMQSQRALEYNQWMVDLVDGVIPVMYEYEEAYRNCTKRLQTIPIPLNVDAVRYEENTVAGKLVVFHGLNRYGFKGTRHVEAAFKRLAERYPNDLELVIDGHLPLAEYLQLLRRANVVVDQMYGYSAGLNALYALAMGKVVIGGSEPESLASLGVDWSPVINVEPSADSLVAVIERLLEQRESIPELGRQSRRYVEEVHDCVQVAGRYVSAWNSAPASAPDLM